MKGDINELIQKLLVCISDPLDYEIKWNQEAQETMEQKVLQYALDSLKKRAMLEGSRYLALHFARFAFTENEEEDARIEPYRMALRQWKKKADHQVNNNLFRTKVRFSKKVLFLYPKCTFRDCPDWVHPSPRSPWASPCLRLRDSRKRTWKN